MKDQIDFLREERDAYKRAAEYAGVCMTCVVRAPEPYGCTDCLNTGRSSEYHNGVHDAHCLMERVDEFLRRVEGSFVARLLGWRADARTLRADIREYRNER